ncbi:hypothetical protein GCM10010357_43980 [Streptomyces luteireticuli]|uniref:Peptidase inhibitor family I36 n=2 Tax=Streptomyces luteireticuli TaxID=173858 RepID=A0ABP3IQY2_9ACTN
MHRVVTAAVAIGLGPAGMFITAPPATAGVLAAPGNCPSGNVCFYPNYDYGGTPSLYPNPTDHSCGSTPIVARGVFNNDDQSWTVYHGDGCTGWGVNISPGVGVSDFIALDSSDPTVRSWR